MKVPPKRKGNFRGGLGEMTTPVPSMKVPPKRKGNRGAVRHTLDVYYVALNESPSEKEGKSLSTTAQTSQI